MTASNTKIYQPNQKHIAINELVGAMDGTDVPLMTVVNYDNSLLTPSNHVFVKGRYVATGIINSFDNKQLSLFKAVKLFVKSRFVIRKIYHQGVYLFAADELSYNYYHWLCEALPRFLMMQTVFPSALAILPGQFKNIAFISDSLKLMGFEILWIEEGVTHIFQKMVTVQTKPRYAIVDTELQYQVKQQLFKGIKMDAAKLPWRKVYISRSKSGYRKIKNEEKIVEIVKSLGYEILFAEDYTFVQQAEIFNETKYLIAMHGAGLSNMMFMQPDTNVFEIRIEGWMTQPLCFWRLANIFKIKWSYYLTKAAGDGSNFTDVTVEENMFKQQVEIFTE